jgi:Flp pilus assembly protein TadD
MRMSSSALLLLAVLCLLPFVLEAESQWVEVRSPHFSVVTDAGERRGREVAIRFEQMRAVFAALMTKANVNLPVPLQIVAFRNTKEMRQFVPLWNGKPIQAAGLFQGGEDRTFILLDMSTENPWTVVFHEYAHQLLNGNIRGRTPPWFDEGFAEFFSTIEVESKRAKVGAKPPPGDWDILQQNRLMKVSELFRVRQDMQIYNEGNRRSLFYAESWLIVHYLYDTHQVKNAFDYFNLVLAGMTVEGAIQKAFGMAPAELDKTLQEYLARGRVQYAMIDTPPGIETTGYTVTPVGPADAQAVLADAHLHSPAYLEIAMEEFAEILKLQPDNAAALRGLGYGYLRKRDLKRAGEYFQKAANLNSKDPRVHYYSALLMNQEQGLRNDPDRIINMKKEAQAAIALDPTFADAYSLFAFACELSGEPEQALTAAEKAVELNPRNEMYLMNLSGLYLAQRKIDDAIRILHALQSSSNPVFAERACESLAQAERLKEAFESSARQEAPLTSSEPGNRPVDRQVKEVEEEPPASATVGKTTGVKFLKGKLVSVDCSASPTAILTVVANGKTLKLKVADIGHVVVIGADAFSCQWTNQRIALNYRETSDDQSNVMSVEIQ